MAFPRIHRDLRVTRPARRGRGLAILTSAALTLTAAVAINPGSASAEPTVPEPARPAFYEQPETMPANNGTLIRSEEVVVGPGDQPYDSTLVLYRTTNREGTPVAASGIVFVPKTPWTGAGPRPIIGYSPGTQGLADRCAPSRQFVDGVEYEGIFMDGLLKSGYAVAMTDYIGLGTAGVHTYMERVSQGHAVLDTVRAAQQLEGLSPEAPVGIQGYSQGGSGSAAAIELAPTYAPDLNIVGASVGAPGANLFDVAKQLDGTHFAAFLLYATRGIGESYHVDPTPYLNAKGLAKYSQVEGECVFDLFNHSFQPSKQLTVNGQPASTLLAQEPWRTIIDEQRIGRLKPTMPVLISHSRFDDALPWKQGRQLGVDWCKQGANVRFNTTFGFGHFGGMFDWTAASNRFWKARFAGQQFQSNCGWF